MNIEILINAEPLRLDPVSVPGAGAVARFDGVVRGLEEGAEITGLEYEAYLSMAEKVIREILEELSLAHPFLLARVHHRIGFVPVAEAAILMDVHSKHRAEAFAVLAKFMDRLKLDVPIWKRSAGVPPVNVNDGGQDARVPFFCALDEIDISQHRLPHWQQGSVWQFVTWRLGDSMPAGKLDEWECEKANWLQIHPQPWTEEQENEYHTLFSRRVDEWLDAGHGSCLLRNSECAGTVKKALMHFDGQRYQLGPFVIMPNHVHVLFRPFDTQAIQQILHSWKSYTAKEINRLAGRSGALWQEDYWDRMVRHESHFEACVKYILANPEKARLKPGEYQRSAGVPPVNVNDGGQDALARAPASAQQQ
ncbi:MAG: molybdenum cofactor biosynthesis protein MoaE, partial [Terrimicrobiaceae bacterium]